MQKIDFVSVSTNSTWNEKIIEHSQKIEFQIASKTQMEIIGIEIEFKSFGRNNLRCQEKNSSEQEIKNIRFCP